MKTLATDSTVQTDNAALPDTMPQVDSVTAHYPIADRMGFFSGSQWANGDSAIRMVGVSGEPVPYRLSNDVVVTATLMLCLFMGAFVVCRSMHALAMQLKNFFRLRDRSEDFSLKSEGEIKDQLFVVLLESIVLSLLCFSFFSHRMADRITILSPYILLLANMGVLLIYFAYKYGVLNLFNWTFFDTDKRQTWMRSYNLIAFGKAIILLPLLMVILYFDLPPSVCICATLSIIALAEMLVLYKTKQIFFTSVLGLFPTILYFCALELLPLFFLWELLVATNEFLVI